MEYLEIMPDGPSQLKRYEAATREAKEVFIHRALGAELSHLEVNSQTGSTHTAPTIVLRDFSSDSLGMKEDESPAHTQPVWLQAIVLTAVISVATLLLVLVAVSATQIAKHFL